MDSVYVPPQTENEKSIIFAIIGQVSFQTLSVPQVICIQYYDLFKGAESLLKFRGKSVETKQSQRKTITPSNLIEWDKLLLLLAYMHFISNHGLIQSILTATQFIRKRNMLV